MTVFILGAGCTYGTLSKRATCPPLAKDFGKSLSRKKYPSLVDVASHLGKDLEKLGLEEIWTYIDFYTKFTENRGGFLRDQEWLTGGAVCELKRAILSIYGHACDCAARAVNSSTACTLLALMESVRGGDVIISFNYDTLVERLARKLRLRLRHGTGPALKNEVRFAKPHGSTTWRVQGLHPPVSGPPLLDSLPEQTVMRGCSNTEPLVLGAVPIKSELIAEVQRHWGACESSR